jgi:endonuclease G
METARRVARETKTVAAEADAVVAVTAEGLIPGLRDHRLELYIANIRRYAAEPSEMRVDRALQVAQDLRATNFATEVVRGSFSVNYSAGGTPVLLRVRTPQWEPPEGMKIQSRVGLFVTARATDEQLTTLRNDPDVVSVDASRDASGFECAVSMPFIRVTEVHLPSGGSPGEYGDRALVGVIDSGIDILHEAFLDANGQTRILAIWNQREGSARTRTPHGSDPTTFTQDYGGYYGPAEISDMRDDYHRGITAAIPPALRDPAQDPLGNPQPGHGTHVASIAAGRAIGGFAGGVAPDAKLIVVIPNMETSPDSPPSLGYSNSHIDAIAFLQSAARKLGMPMVVNVSLGMNAGAHDGLSNLEAAFDALTDNGKLPGFVIVKSAGNEGDKRGHAEVQAVAGVLKTIAWDSADQFRLQDYIEVWYDEWQDLTFELLDPHGNRSPTVCQAAPIVNTTLAGNYCSLALRFPHPDNGHHLLQITIVPQTRAIQPGRWTLEIVGRSVAGARPMVHAWVERHASPSVAFVTGDSNAMTISIPGTAEHVITVAACSATIPLRVPQFSSQGLTRDGRPKPDLCAPGDTVIAAASNCPDTRAVVALRGTSMAAPHVSGAIALALSLRAKSGRPQLNANQLKAALKRTTKGANGIHDREIGFGALDVAAFLQNIGALR